jgi:hypothetical protein
MKIRATIRIGEPRIRIDNGITAVLNNIGMINTTIMALKITIKGTSKINTMTMGVTHLTKDKASTIMTTIDRGLQITNTEKGHLLCKEEETNKI